MGEEKGKRVRKKGIKGRHFLPGRQTARGHTALPLLGRQSRLQHCEVPIPSEAGEVHIAMVRCK